MAPYQPPKQKAVNVQRQNSPNKIVGLIQQLFAQPQQQIINQPTFHQANRTYGDAYEYVIQGDAALAQDLVEDAMLSYQKALELSPSLFEAKLGQGRCYRRVGNLKRAMQTYDQILSLNQFSGPAHLEMAKTLHEAGFLEKAIFHFKCAVKLQPRDIEIRFNLAVCCELNESFDQAAKVYEDLIGIDPNFAPAYNNLGSIYMRKGLYKAAEKLFRQLSVLMPEFTRAYLGLAICLDRLNRPKEALPFYEKVLVCRFHSKNREFIESRIRTIRRYVGMRPNITTAGNQLIRVK